MPYIAQQLIQEQQTLVTVQLKDPLQKAIDLMIENDFSQLPVVQADLTLQGMITSDGVVKAVGHFGLSLDRLKVSHASETATAYRQDDDISAILKGLKEKNAVAIINKTHELQGMVTSYDTTEYFRRRAEDIMLAEDIEITLRDFIEAAHHHSNGDLNEEKLSKSIDSIMPSGEEAKRKFRSAVHRYVSSTNEGDNKIDTALIDEIYQEKLFQKNREKSFEELNLSEYIALFKKVWSEYKSDFYELDWSGIEKLLNEVRKSRNAIAHFRDITLQEREQLKFCSDFLGRHRLSPNGVETQSVTSTPFSDPKDPTQHLKESSSISEIIPIEEELNPNESRYTPLARWLEGQSDSKISLTFSEIETLIEDSLPPSARKHRNWWANDSVSHTQSQQWLDAGWRVSSVNMNLEKVKFQSIGNRQSAYIDFFSNLKRKLQSVSSLPIRNTSNPQGRNWFTLELILDNGTHFYVVCSFTRHSRFRLEHYIDTGDKDKNKSVFDAIFKFREKIESDFGEPIEWERMSSKRSSRVAFYRDNSSIDAAPEQLEEIQDWTVSYLPLFFEAVAKNSPLPRT